MGRLSTVAAVLSLPPTLAHEATHWAVARLGTDDAAMAVEVRGGRAMTAWPPLQSRVLRVFAFLSPTVFGSVLAAVWLVSGFEPTPWRVLFAIGLAMYTVPSGADLRGALGLQASQQKMSQKDNNRYHYECRACGSATTEDGECHVCGALPHQKQ